MRGKRFEKGNQVARKNKGKKHPKTIVREKLQINEIDDLKETVLKNFNELANDTSKNIKALATKEIAKYIFPQKRETELKFNGTINFIANQNIVPPNPDGD